jgi:hypothetical protein
MLFDARLDKEQVDYYSEQNQPGNFIRYYFLSEDGAKIDRILMENEIVGNAENYLNSDFRMSAKSNRIYLLAVVIVVSILIAIRYIFD